jgi:hypothetical protein
LAQWQKKTYKLEQMYGWKAKPGYNIFVADRGAVRFDFPDSWVLKPGENSVIELRDKEPPDDDCLLQLSVFHLPPWQDWRGLPMGKMLQDCMAGGDDGREVTNVGPIFERSRDGMDMAWRETAWIAPPEQDSRPALTRSCLAHKDLVQVLLTMELWTDDRDRFAPVWDEILRTLRLAEYKRRPDK